MQAQAYFVGQYPIQCHAMQSSKLTYFGTCS